VKGTIVSLLVGFLATLGLFPMAQSVYSQQVKIYPNAKSLTTDEYLILTVEVKGKPGRYDPVFPQIEGFQSRGNRQVQNEETILFQRIYQSMRPGTYTVPTFSYQGFTKSFTSPSFDVTVTGTQGKKNQPPPGSAPANDPLAEMEALMQRMMKDLDAMDGQSILKRFFGPHDGDDLSIDMPSSASGSNDFFLLTQLDKKSCFVGEQVLCQIELVIADELVNEVGVYLQGLHSLQSRMNSLGFWQEVLDLEYLTGRPTLINGKRYVSYIIYQTILFPLAEGMITLSDIYLDVLRFPGRRIHDPLESLQASPGDGGSKEVKAKSIPVLLEVKPLPKTLMPFSGAVASELSARLEVGKGPYRTGEPIELTVTIEGRGNLATCKPPVVITPESFLEDPPTANFSIVKNQAGYFCTREFTLSYVPLKGGKQVVGPVKFFYFRPEKMWYDSLVIDSFDVAIMGADISAEDLARSDEDIFYKHAIAQASDHGPAASMPMEYPLFVGSGIALAGALAWRMRKRRQSA
jgi:hypothetical protein